MSAVLSLLSFLVLVICIFSLFVLASQILRRTSITSWGAPPGGGLWLLSMGPISQWGAVFSSEGQGVLLPAQRVQVNLRAHNSHPHLPGCPILDLKAVPFLSASSLQHQKPVETASTPFAVWQPFWWNPVPSFQQSAMWLQRTRTSLNAAREAFWLP